ncbi:hypothetical protein Q428_02440 [Fervidicella metallireducens AeB]|uniref:DUF6385 domain-containing protein n=1 Tax=Fervidicella metallireducens AeB TaxID=1403537 RepID=A0A017RYM6_9CLOT|nr:DUF6385 domain-containing protein [Fervidicella metallireducens]EYE89499.1 hypothetical protein Q428_02440 [Fervidicella metallireducens AeB]
MPNNIIFNDSAQNLKVQIYGSNTNTPLQVDGSGNMFVNVANNVTVTGAVNVSNTVEIRALTYTTDTVTVTGAVNVANSVDIRALSYTVDSITVTGAVNVSNTVDIRALSYTTDTVTVTGAVDVANSPTVQIGGYAFTASNATLTSDEGTTITSFKFDTSQYKLYTFYIYNSGTNPITAELEVSPVDTDSYFVSDKSIAVPLAGGEKQVLIPGYFLKYTRVKISSLAAFTAEVYFNGQM